MIQVSDPRSPRYGDHLSTDEVQALVAPDPNAAPALTAWLRGCAGTGASDVAIMYPTNDFIKVAFRFFDSSCNM